MIISIAFIGENDIQTKNQVTLSSDTAYYMKGVWVSYITLDMQNEDKSEKAFKNKIEKIISTSKENGFNTLIMQVRPFCDALYKSSVYPWSHILTGEQGKNPLYDPLKIACDLCHKNNMKIHAWINPYRVSSESTPKELSSNNPYVKDNSIGFIFNKNIYLDPSNKKAQELIVNGVEEIANNYDIDGIQFDDYFYPEESAEIDKEQYKAYKSSTPKPLSKEKWRMENVNTLIKRVYKAINKINDNIEFGISPQGNINNNKALGADVYTWCKEEGYIDYICPQLYFSLDNPSLTFEESLNQWVDIEKHKNLKIYVGLAGYKAGSDKDSGTWLDNNDILKTEIKICEERKLDGIMLYSYESLISKENKEEIKNVSNYLNGVTQ